MPSILLALILLTINSFLCIVFVLWPDQALTWLHLPQWMGLAVMGFLLSWLIGE